MRTRLVILMLGSMLYCGFIYAVDCNQKRLTDPDRDGFSHYVPMNSIVSLWKRRLRRRGQL